MMKRREFDWKVKVGYFRTPQVASGCVGGFPRYHTHRLFFGIVQNCIHFGKVLELSHFRITLEATVIYVGMHTERYTLWG